jgi:hypothetical protein
MNDSTDPWIKGTPELKSFALGFYTIVNFLGVLINSILIWSILRSRDKTSRDIFIAGLSSGCLVMSGACATQCALNYSSSRHRYQYEGVACYFEAYFHVSAIIVQFMNIMMIAWSSYASVINRKSISTTVAAVWVIMIWMSEALGVAVLSRFSKVILMPDGAYCFFDFTSVVIVYWFTPVMLLTLSFIVYFYFKIYRLAQASNTVIKINGQDPMTGPNGDRTVRGIALRSMIFVGVFFIGWFPAVITCVYAVIHGYATEPLDIYLAISGSTHSVLQPLAYGIYNRNLHKLIVYCFPSCGDHLNLEVANLRGRETIITVGKKPTPMNSKVPDVRRLSLLPGQIVDFAYQQDSPTKQPTSLSPPKSPERTSPSSHRKKWPSSGGNQPISRGNINAFMTPPPTTPIVLNIKRNDM